MSQIKNIAVAGAGGNIGPSIVQCLLQHGFTVTILARLESSSDFDPAAKVVHTDYTPSSLALTLQGQDAVIGTMGFQGLEIQHQLIDACVETGVKRYIPSEYGLSPEYFSTAEFIQMNQPKVLVMEYLKKKVEANPGFSYTGVASGIFLDWSLSVFPVLGFNLKAQSGTIIDSGNKIVTSCTLSTIGEAVAQVLLHPGKTKNRLVKICETETCQNEILAVLEAERGKSWEVKHEASGDILNHALENLKAGNMVPGFVGVLKNELFGDHAVKGLMMEGEDNELLGIKQVDIREIVKGCLETACDCGRCLRVDFRDIS